MDKVEIAEFEDPEAGQWAPADDEMRAEAAEDDFWTKAGKWWEGVWKNADKSDEKDENARAVKKEAEETKQDCERLKLQQDAEKKRQAGARQFIVDFNEWWPISNKLIDERVRRREWTPEMAQEVKNAAGRVLEGYVEEATRSYEELKRINTEVKDNCMGAMKSISGQRTWAEIRSGTTRARAVLSNGRTRYRGSAQQRYPRLVSGVRAGLRVYEQVRARPDDPTKVHAFAGKSERTYVGAPPE